MKAILEFELPEDKEHFDASTKGMDWALLVWHIDQFIRNKIKYEQDRDGVLQLVRNELNFQMEEKGLKYPERIEGGAVAHLGERIPCTDEVASSILVSSTKK